MFGLPMSSPSRREPPAELPAMPPPTAICARCESTVVLAGRQLPRSWAIVDGDPVCGDCRHVKSSTAAMLRQALACRRPRTFVIGERVSRYHGCRVEHEIALDQAAILMRAEQSTPEGRDDAISFLLDARELDQLIIHLANIRDELRSGKGPAARPRGGH